MIVKMEKMTICGLVAETENFLGELMRCGCLQINEPESLDEYEVLEEKLSRNVGDLYGIEQRLSRFSGAVSTLSKYEPKQSMFARPQTATFAEIGSSQLGLEAEELCANVEFAISDLSEKNAAIGKEQFKMTSLEPWKKSDLPLEITATGLCAVQYMIFPANVDVDALLAKLADDGLTAYLQKISASQEQCYYALVCLQTEQAKIWEHCRDTGASHIDLSGYIGTPKAIIAGCEKHIQELQEEIAFLQEQLREMATQSGKLKMACDNERVKLDLAKSRLQLMHTEKVFLCSAWVPAKKRASVEAALARYHCYWEVTKPGPGEEAPVAFKNNPFIEPFETVTEMYSMPLYQSMDPNPIVSIFYFVLFGLMLSDVGYGFILAIGGFLGAKLLSHTSMAKMLRMFGWCGIATIIAGAMYGSFFGDAILRVSDTFFGHPVSLPALLDPLKDPMTILVISLGLGVLHVFVGMGMKAYLMLRRGQFWEAVFDVGFWYLLLIGLPLLALGGTPGQVGMYMAIAGAAGVILTKARDQKNPIARVFFGILGLYDITGYLSDVLSYSRILALGLSTAVISMVFNMLGTMPGNSLVGVIVFILLFTVGHAINFALSVLGSFVHTLRLQYVEFFGKFFEDGGVPFIPLKANPQYVLLTNKEEIN